MLPDRCGRCGTFWSGIYLTISSRPSNQWLTVSEIIVIVSVMHIYVVQINKKTCEIQCSVHCQLESQASLIARGHTISTSCTGVYTVETAAAIVEKTVNQSALVDGLDVYFQCNRCFDSFLNICY